jgi:hypothetical protein
LCFLRCKQEILEIRDGWPKIFMRFHRRLFVQAPT